MNSCLRAALLAVGLVTAISGLAGYSTDKLDVMPEAFDHSWIGLSAGVKNTPFNNSYLASGFDANRIKHSIAALRLTIGHYFNPYIGLSANLMRGVHSNKFYLNTSPSETKSVPESLFGLTARPTLPLGKHLGLYGELGPGFISRRGFSVGDTNVVNNATLFTFILGGGVYYKLPFNVFLDLQAIYATGNKSQQQPPIYYIGFGVNYMLQKSRFGPVNRRNDDWFPLNFTELSYFNHQVFYADVAKYFTTPKSIPIFFDGHIKLNQGMEAMYERTFYHTERNFSLEWGASIAHWQSRDLNQQFSTVSIFPELKLWLIRSPSFDFYFTYSLAGPTYISRRYIDHHDSGSHFTFQDFLGFGAFIGRSKLVSVSLKIVHYSNGNTLPVNPGVCAPVLVGLGVSF